QARHYIERIDPDAVVLNSTFLTPERTVIVTPSLEDTLADLTSAGVAVIAGRDLLRRLLHQADCVADRVQEAPASAPTLTESMLAAQAEGVFPVEVNDLVCPEGVCRPVIGNVRVSIDPDHISASYAASMQDAVRERLRKEGFAW